MAEAKITVSFTPGEFDLVREILKGESLRALSVAKDTHTDAKIRQEERQLSAQIEDIMSRLR
jgi:hypothetical protein